MEEPLVRMTLLELFQLVLILLVVLEESLSFLADGAMLYFFWQFFLPASLLDDLLLDFDLALQLSDVVVDFNPLVGGVVVANEIKVIEDED